MKKTEKTAKPKATIAEGASKRNSQGGNTHQTLLPSLSQLRRYAVKGEYPDYVVSPEFQCTPKGSIIDCFEHLLFPSMGCEMEKDSIQYVLMDYLRKNGHENITKQHRAARVAARGVVFDCAVALYSVRKSESGLNLEDAFYRASLIQDPDSILWDDNIRQYLANGMRSTGSKFLKGLADDFYNAARRHDILRIDWPLCVMGVHWTNTHCPLWLMEREAILETCKHLSSNGSWSKALVEDRIKKFKLLRGPAWPIVGVLTEPSSSTDDASATRLISGFEIARKAFPALQEMKFQSPFFQKTEQQSVKRRQIVDRVPRLVFSSLGEYRDKQKRYGNHEKRKPVSTCSYKLIRRSTTRHRVDP